MINSRELIDNLEEIFHRLSSWRFRSQLCNICTELEAELIGMEECIDKHEYRLAADKMTCAYESAKRLIELVDKKCPVVKEYWKRGG